MVIVGTLNFQISTDERSLRTVGFVELYPRIDGVQQLLAGSSQTIDLPTIGWQKPYNRSHVESKIHIRNALVGIFNYCRKNLRQRLLDVLAKQNAQNDV